MEGIHINFMAVLVTVVVNFFIGFIWFTPLFGKIWAKENGFDMSAKPPASVMIKGMLFSVLGNFFLAFVLAHNVAAWGFVPESQAMTHTQNILSSGIFTWLGFFVPVDLNTVAWEGKSWKLFAINTGYHFISVLVASAILVLM